MTNDEMIAVIAAHKEGKLIEFKRIEGYPHHWTRCDDPVWNFGVCEYRVRPEDPKPTYRPYANARECVLDAIKNGWFVRKATKNGNWLMKLFVSEDSVITEVRSISFRELLESYTWEDGSPCGVKED